MSGPNDIIVMATKAAVAQDEVSPNTIISISREPQKVDYGALSLTALDRLYLAEAREIEKALCNGLPGGTYDCLLRCMLERKASHFRVRLGDRDD